MKTVRSKIWRLEDKYCFECVPIDIYSNVYYLMGDIMPHDEILETLIYNLDNFWAKNK